MSMIQHRYQNIPVKAVEKVTADCAVITLDIDEPLAATYAFQAGQYLTLEADIEGEPVRRSYSLCSSPLDHSWRVAVKQIPAGKFSTFANTQLKAGDILRVFPPNGRFGVQPDPTQTRHYAAFAAGSGITPILSIMKTLLGQEPHSTFKLFYTSRDVASIILKEELEGLKNTFLGRVEIFHFLTQEARSVELFNGRINHDKLDAIFRHLLDPTAIQHYFLCGPEEMIFLIKDYLLGRGTDKEHIHFELFHTDKKPQLLPPPTPKAQGTVAMTAVTLTEGGKTFQFSIPTGTEPLLDAGIRHKADLPFACKGGVCCTCKAKLLEGQVSMQVNYALEPEEVAQGYILSCQAVPVSEKIVVDFDV